ncbi:MAG: hypothetical protein WCF14_07730 [Nitrososphaeraceae archaeon]
MAIGLIGVGLFVLLVIQVADVSAQQIVTNGSLNATSNTNASNATNATTISNAFDQLKDTFGSLFGK